MNINDNSREYLREASKWSRFVAIIGFILVGFMVLFGFGYGTIMQGLMGDAYILPFPGYVFGFIYLLLALVYFFPLLYLFRFATHTKSALTSEDDSELATALFNLKSLYRFIGILMIIMLVIYGLAIVGGVLAFLFADMLGTGTYDV